MEMRISLCFILLNIFCFSVCLADDHVRRLEDSPYEVISMYDIPMSVEPLNVQILKPQLSTAQDLATFDLVYTTAIGEIRKLSDLPKLITQPEWIPSKTSVVTSGIHLPNPNRVGILPKNTVGGQPPVVWWIAGGAFSSLGTSRGAIYLMKMVTNNVDLKFNWEPVPIYSHVDSVFSHVEWLDMDIDGRRDCVTVKDTKADGARMIWLRQPPNNEKVWVENAISNLTDDLGGSDFRALRWSMKKRRNNKVFAVAGKRTNTITVIWNDDIDNDWTQTHRVRSRVIAKYDQFVNIEVGDLNGDGRPEILATVAAISGKAGRLIAYEAPTNGDFGNGRWRKHVLAEWQSKTKYYLISPRAAKLFYPNNERQRKPHILVSGGSDRKVYVVSPKSWSYISWTYTVHEIFSDQYSVGTPAIKDVDGDGNAEIFIPSGKRIHVMRFALASGGIKAESNLLLTFILMASLIFLNFVR